ncbi:hypothetical protein HY604_04895 [Candidatus Peregrinibacteria bacterium]|nr:hypothetical protein [Candidatus Peregrinibacteria bacterium]
MQCLGIRSERRFYRCLDDLSKERKGVVLGIRRKILELSPLPGVDADLVVLAAEGLPIDYISGLDALGQFELDEILQHDFRNV